MWLATAHVSVSGSSDCDIGSSPICLRIPWLRVAALAHASRCL
eukprot:SAG31_NODE_17726_length_660_cov_0.643494_2_plen_42_part_01